MRYAGSVTPVRLVVWAVLGLLARFVIQSMPTNQFPEMAYRGMLKWIAVWCFGGVCSDVPMIAILGMACMLGLLTAMLRPRRWTLRIGMISIRGLWLLAMISIWVEPWLDPTIYPVLCVFLFVRLIFLVGDFERSIAWYDYMTEVRRVLVTHHLQNLE
ncbi:hypothetical protein [Tuwongella immobilis]|uniref:Uncharacterized protein n=1 Tax=Tuwongella immobilis TaxID=692036 RepID=A0A6C2YJE2_9BACT|nr:hypothetical protein [Tuwongella immobilis]VIP01487.1 unnamed protein product [Tuwongella immobilis]VTR98553.1 unnamed protein product [Tuwongella immobilis]